MKTRPRNSYPGIYIEELRLKVIEAYKFYEPIIILKPNKSRGSKGYKILFDLVIEKTRNKISPSALVQFFTKDIGEPWFDDVLVNFEIYTIETLENFFKVYENDLDKEKSSNKAPLPKVSNGETKPKNFELAKISSHAEQAIKTLLDQLYSNQKSVISAEMIMTIEENAATTLLAKVYLTAQSDISVLRIHIYADHGIQIKEINAYEYISKNNLPICPYLVNDNSYLGYIILPEILKEGNSYTYHYRLVIENYSQDLILKKESDEQKRILAKRCKTLKDIYRFPNTDFFKKVSITVYNHPNASLMGRKIKHAIKDNYKIFTIDHGNVYDADSLIEYKITI